MGAYTTLAATRPQFEEIIDTLRTGTNTTRPSPRTATVLMIQANLGLRIQDVLGLKLSDIVNDGGRWRLDITEQKTGKKRRFTVLPALHDYLVSYAYDNGIGRDDPLFPITPRAVQKQLHGVCDFLGYERISTHSFRKMFATEIYNANGHDVVLVQHLLQHASAATTQRYIGIEPERIETALNNHNFII